MSEDNENTGLVRLSESELAALVPQSLDALLSPTHTSSAAPEKRRVNVPYVAFRGKKSEKNEDALDAAGILVNRNGDGTFYLVDAGEPIKVQKGSETAFPLHVINWFRAYTLYEKDGNSMNPIEASLKNSDELFNVGFREEIFAAVAVPVGDGHYTAATLRLRGAQCAAFRKTLDLLGEPGRPGPACDPAKWGSRSPQHAISAKAKIPGARFLTSIWSTLEPPKSGKGQPFNQGHSATRPTTAEEVAAFNAWVEKDWPRIQLAVTKYNAIVEQVRRLAQQTLEPAGDDKGDPIPF